MNFSKSGLGLSTGVKGLRFSTNAKGSYVSMGAGGIRYRAKIGSGYGSTTNRQRSQPAQTTYQPHDSVEYGHIHTASVDQLVDSSSVEILRQINEVASKKSYAPLAYLSVGLLCLFLLVTIPWLAALTAVLFAYPVWKLYTIERVGMTYALFFDLGPNEEAEWNRRLEGLRQLSKSNRVWRVVTAVDVVDQRRNAGAGSEVRRVPVIFLPDDAPRLTANIKPFSVKVGNQSLVFLPDRIYIHENGRYGAVDYAQFQIECSDIRFIETDPVPTDAQIVDRTWRYVNKNGTPDRRFNGNHEIPIALYANLLLKSGTGLNMIMYVSSVPQAKLFATSFTSMKGASRSKTGAANSQHGAPGQPGVPGPSPKKPSAWYFVELNVSSFSTKDEVTAAYRTMAKAYHPDVVAHLAPEFRALAEDRMKSINAAYAEIKVARGW